MKLRMDIHKYIIIYDMTLQRTNDEEELNDFKQKLAERAKKAKLANQKHRMVIKQKLNDVKTDKDDERIEEVLDLVKQIKKLMLDPISDTDSDSDTDSEDEPSQEDYKRKSKREDDDDVPKKKRKDKREDDDVPKKKRKDKREDDDVPKKKRKDKRVEDEIEPDISDDLQLKRKFPYQHQYSTYV